VDVTEAGIKSVAGFSTRRQGGERMYLAKKGGFTHHQASERGQEKMPNETASPQREGALMIPAAVNRDT